MRFGRLTVVAVSLVIAVGVERDTCAQDYSNLPKVSLTRADDLFDMRPAAFADWLRTGRPDPVSAADKARTLSSLPPRGELTDLNGVALTKLAALRRALNAAERDTTYVIKIIDVPQAVMALHARAVLLISETALNLLGVDELQALTLHEIGHEYVWDDYARAVRLEDSTAIQQLELICDAIAIAMLQRLRIDSWRLISGLEKIGRFNRDQFGRAVNEESYPTFKQRRAFAGQVRAWLMATSPDGREQR